MFEDRLNELKAYLLNSHPKHKESLISVDALVDAVIAVYEDCKSFTGAEKTGPIPKFLQRFGQAVSNLKALRLNKEDFNYIRLLAKGQFGEVSLVRGKFDGKVYAMKVLRKAEMLKQQDIAFFMEERQILAALDSIWITHLFAAFQDENNLYLVMDYLPGGDLSNLIMRADEGTLTLDEPFVKFYIAETLMALGDLHKLNFVHRDLKPGNILLDSSGHVKLADFGSCIQLDDKIGVSSQVTVGTPDYISPEVLQANEGKGSYGQECDFWSLGITMYEMLVGDPPFYAESLTETFAQIMAHEEYLQFPEDVKLSVEAKDIIKRLICDKSKRLKTVDEIKSHPFFKGIDWEKLHETHAPFLPEIKNDEDVSNFAELDEEDDVPASKAAFFSNNKNFTGTNLAFVGYSFTRFRNLYDIVSSAEAKQELAGSLKPTDSTWETKLAQAETECDKLRSKLVQEGKKIVSLEISQSTLEHEISRIKKVLSSEMEKLTGKEEQVTQLEKDKKIAAIELENVQKKYNQTLDERADLELRLQQMTEISEKDQKISSQTKEQLRLSLEEKTHLESSLEANQKKLNSQLEKIKEYTDQIGDLSKAKALLELEVDHLKLELENEKNQKENLMQQLAEVESQVERDSSRKQALETALSEAETIMDELRNSLDETRSELAEQSRIQNELNNRIAEVESAKNASDRELVAMKLKVEELSAVPSSNSAPPSPTKTSLVPGRRNSILFKKNPKDENRQLELEIGLRRQANQEAAKLAAEKIAVENQLRDSQAKLNSTKADLIETKNLVKTLEEKLHGKKNITLARGMSRVSGSEYDLSVLDQETKQKLEKKLADLMKSAAVATVEMSDLKKKLNDEQEQKQHLESKIYEYENQIRDLSKSKAFFEIKSQEMEVLSESISRDLKISRNDLKKLGHIKELQDEEIENLAKRVASVETERDEIHQKLENITKHKIEAESEVESLKTRLNELLNSHIDPNEFENVAEECNKFHKELIEMTSKYDELNIKYKRISPADGELRKPEFNRTSYHSGSNEDVESIDNSKRTRMNNAKLKGLEQQLTVEIAKRSSLETELAASKQTKQVLEYEVEELRKQIATLSTKIPAASVDRPISVSSHHRHSLEFEYKIRKLRPLLFPEGNHPILQGWIRVRIPKNSKKTKFDWIKKFAVVRDSKLFLFDKEKDSTNLDAKAVLNLRAELYSVRSVSPNELIHLTPKEVASVFCISLITSPYMSLLSLDNLAEKGDEPESVLWERRSEAVNKSIEKETQFEEANKKMLALASGETKKRLQSELDDCLRRQKILKQEKSDIEKAMKHLENDTSTIVSVDPNYESDTKSSATGIGNALEIVREIEKKEAYRRGVENMISVTKNEEAKASLNSQLIQVSQNIDILKTSLSSLDNLDSFGLGTIGSRASLNAPKKLIRKPKVFEQIGEAAKGPSFIDISGSSYFMAIDDVDKTRWIAGIDCIRTNVREIPRKSSGGDIDYLLRGDD